MRLKKIPNTLLIALLALTSPFCGNDTDRRKADSVPPQSGIQNEQAKPPETPDYKYGERFVRAAGEGNLPLVRELVGKGVSLEFVGMGNTGDGYNTALMSAAGAEHFHVAEYLLRKGADINACSYSSPLIAAIVGKNHRMVKYLIGKGADVNQNVVVDVGWNPLMCAVHSGSIEMVSLLLNKGARVNDVSESGSFSALSVALGEKKYRIASLLIRKGACVNFRDTDGRTLLMRAVADNDAAAVRMLVCAGAGVNVRDGKGKRAIDYAEEHHHLSVGDLLNDLRSINCGKTGR